MHNQWHMSRCSVLAASSVLHVCVSTDLMMVNSFCPFAACFSDRVTANGQCNDSGARDATLSSLPFALQRKAETTQAHARARLLLSVLHALACGHVLYEHVQGAQPVMSE